MKKYCPNCKKVISKVNCELTVTKEDGVRRKNRCLECNHLFYTTEVETDKLDFDIARRRNV